MREGENRTAKVINGLVKDELSAVETYHQARRNIADHPAGTELRRIETEHEEAARLLKEKVALFGAEPAAGSGAWGTWAKAIEGAAAFFGEKAAIKALKEGEEHGVKDYETALRDESLPSDVKELIRANLLPRTRAHIPVLERFLV